MKHQFSWLNRLSITAKFSTAFAVLLSLLLVMGLVSVFSFSSATQQLEQTIGTSVEIQRLTMTMTLRMEEARRLEADFFLRYPSEGVRHAKENYALPALKSIEDVLSLRAELESLISSAQMSDALIREGVELGSYLSAANGFNVSLNESVALIEVLAMDDVGLLSRLQAESLHLKQLLSAVGYPALYEAYLDMQLHELGYFIERKRSFMQSAFDRAYGLEKILTQDMNLPQNQLEPIFASLIRFKVIVADILELDNAISEKIIEFDQQANVVDSISGQLVDFVTEEVFRAQAKIQQTQQAALITLGGVIVAGLLLALLVAKLLNDSVTRKIIELSAVARAFKDGQMVRASVDSADELGLLAASFNEMAEEKERSEEELRQTQALLKASIDQSPAGIIIADAPDVRIRIANPAALNIRGGEMEDLTDIEVEEHVMRWQAFYPDGTPYVPEDLPLSRAILKGETSRDVLAIIRNEEGEERWISVNAAPIYGDDGSILAGIIVFPDVTERKRVMEALEVSEHKYRSFVSAGVEGIYSFKVTPPMPMDISTEGQVDWIARHAVIEITNDVFAQMYGFESEDDVIGLNFIELMRGDEEATHTVVREFIQSGYNLKSQETPDVSSSGEKVWFMSNAVSFFEERKLIRIWGSQIDITERKLAEEELLAYRDNLEVLVQDRTEELSATNEQLESEIYERGLVEQRIRVNEARLNSMIETAAEGIITMDKRCTILSFNPSAEKIFGYEAAEVVGKNVNMLMPEPYSSRHDQYVQHYLDTGVSKIIGVGREAIGKRKNGEEFPIELAVSEFHDDNQVMFTGIIHDISVRKAFEHQLSEAKIEAESANLAKGYFLANMSHEIRTPMNSVIGYLDLAVEDPSMSAKTRQNLVTASRSAQSLLRIINDILDVSKMEDGKLELEAITFNMRQLVRDILSSFDVGKKGLRIEMDVQPDIPQCFVGDPTRLRQVFVNLVGNAIKFTDKGVVSIHVNDTENLDEYHFMVKDTGIGIPEDKIDTILAPFTQAEAATTRRYGGTGLGTTISRQIVELMGGHIWIESEEGQGSEFNFTIPLTQSDCAESCHPNCPGNELTEGVTEIGLPDRMFHILIAEDVEENADLVRIRLEQQGHTIKHVWNGQQALEALEEEDFDLVLMDVQMPVLDGLEATRKIRIMEEDSGQYLPIIAMTASVMRDEQEMFMASGMTRVLGKPVDFPVLFSLMEDIVPEGRGETPADPHSVTILAHGSMGELTDLPGIDIAEGMKRWQDGIAFVRALTNFIRAQVNAVDEIETLLDDADIEGARARAHALKGVSGNLAAVRVHELSTNVEGALKSGQTGIARRMFPALSDALKEIDDGLASLASQEFESSGPSRPMDSVEVGELVDKLLNALDKDDPAVAEPLIERISEYVGSDALADVVSALSVFDFDAAKSQTSALAERYGVELRRGE